MLDEHFGALDAFQHREELWVLWSRDLWAGGKPFHGDSLVTMILREGQVFLCRYVYVMRQGPRTPLLVRKPVELPRRANWL